VSGEAPVRVRVDRDACLGVGQCELLEPEVFRLDDDLNLSEVTAPGLLPRARAEIVVDRCPGRAISIVED
jgi:ferredoxin